MENIADYQHIHPWGTLDPLVLINNRRKLNCVEFQQIDMGILNEVRCEAEEAYDEDNEINKIPERAYTDIVQLVRKLVQLGIPMPEFSWAEDGSLSLTWCPKKGMASMGVYGDDLVIYSAYFNEEMQSSGVCKLSDISMLSGFVTTLNSIIYK